MINELSSSDNIALVSIWFVFVFSNRIFDLFLVLRKLNCDLLCEWRRNYLVYQCTTLNIDRNRRNAAIRFRGARSCEQTPRGITELRDQSDTVRSSSGGKVLRKSDDRHHHRQISTIARAFWLIRLRNRGCGKLHARSAIAGTARCCRNNIRVFSYTNFQLPRRLLITFVR